MKKSTIIVKDAVNCTIQGLELPTRRKLSNIFSYEIPGARFTPSVRLGRWNGRVAFFQLSGRTYINLLEEIIPILIEEGYDVELDDQRDSEIIDFVFPRVDKDTYSHVVWPEGHTMEGQPIVLRDHQVTSINNFFENPQCISELATGFGKCIDYDTMLEVAIEENSPFGKFLLNKVKNLQREKLNGNDGGRIMQKIST